MAGIGSHTRPTRGQTDTWLTPRFVLDALGPFDLDPCAAPSPRPWPTAADHIELPRDGLTERWTGRVWLNPPYGPDAWGWLHRLADHGTGIALIFARTETAGFRYAVWDRAAALLFLTGRLTFCRADGTPGAGNSGGPSVLVAYGPDDAAKLRACPLDGVYVPSWRATAPDPRLPL